MRLAAEYPVSLVCGTLDCPRSSYYYQAREPEDQALKEAITHPGGGLLAYLWLPAHHRPVKARGLAGQQQTGKAYYGGVGVPWESLSEEKAHHQ